MVSVERHALFVFLVWMSIAVVESFLASPFCRTTKLALHGVPRCRLRQSYTSVNMVEPTSDQALGSRARSPKSAYIHVPFCKQKCHYCDFPIRVIGKDPTRPKAIALMEEYLDALEVEIKQGGAGGFDTRHSFEDSELETIYIGGGTPSLLQPDQIGRILDRLRDRFGIAEGAEVSMEMDPGTFDASSAAGFRAAGVTRASMGVQSFSDDQLETCGRGHRVREVLDAARALRSGGFRDWSLDMLSGLPGDSVDSFRASLQQALELQPTHVSVYDLIVEEGTAFGWWFGEDARGRQRGAARGTLPDEDQSAEMYRAAHALLSEAGYEHYEISNYALIPEEARERGPELSASPFRSKHNLVYWHRQPFLAFGMGATSFVGNERLKRPTTLPGYLEWVYGGGDSKALVGDEEEGEEEEEGAEGWTGLVEHLMVSLRLREGAPIAELTARYGADAVQEAVGRLQPFVDSGLVLFDELEDSAGRVRLSCPDGFLMSNAVLVELFKE